MLYPISVGPSSLRFQSRCEEVIAAFSKREQVAVGAPPQRRVFSPPVSDHFALGLLEGSADSGVPLDPWLLCLHVLAALPLGTSPLPTRIRLDPKASSSLHASALLQKQTLRRLVSTAAPAPVVDQAQAAAASRISSSAEAVASSEARLRDLIAGRGEDVNLRNFQVIFEELKVVSSTTVHTMTRLKEAMTPSTPTSKRIALAFLRRVLQRRPTLCAARELIEELSKDPAVARLDAQEVALQHIQQIMEGVIVGAARRLASVVSDSTQMQSYAFVQQSCDQWSDMHRLFMQYLRSPSSCAGIVDQLRDGKALLQALCAEHVPEVAPDWASLLPASVLALLLQEEVAAGDAGGAVEEASWVADTVDPELIRAIRSRGDALQKWRNQLRVFEDRLRLLREYYAKLKSERVSVVRNNKILAQIPAFISRAQQRIDRCRASANAGPVSSLVVSASSVGLAMGYLNQLVQPGFLLQLRSLGALEGRGFVDLLKEAKVVVKDVSDADQKLMSDVARHAVASAEGLKAEGDIIARIDALLPCGITQEEIRALEEVKKKFELAQAKHVAMLTATSKAACRPLPPAVKRLVSTLLPRIDKDWVKAAGFDQLLNNLELAQHYGLLALVPTIEDATVGDIASVLRSLMGAYDSAVAPLRAAVEQLQESSEAVLDDCLWGVAENLVWRSRILTGDEKTQVLSSLQSLLANCLSEPEVAGLFSDVSSVDSACIAFTVAECRHRIETLQELVRAGPGPFQFEGLRASCAPVERLLQSGAESDSEGLFRLGSLSKAIALVEQRLGGTRNLFKSRGGSARAELSGVQLRPHRLHFADLGVALLEDDVGLRDFLQKLEAWCGSRDTSVAPAFAGSVLADTLDGGAFLASKFRAVCRTQETERSLFSEPAAVRERMLAAVLSGLVPMAEYFKTQCGALQSGCSVVDLFPSQVIIVACLLHGVEEFVTALWATTASAEDFTTSVRVTMPNGPQVQAAQQAVHAANTGLQEALNARQRSEAHLKEEEEAVRLQTKALCDRQVVLRAQRDDIVMGRRTGWKVEDVDRELEALGRQIGEKNASLRMAKDHVIACVKDVEVAQAWQRAKAAKISEICAQFQVDTVGCVREMVGRVVQGLSAAVMTFLAGCKAVSVDAGEGRNACLGVLSGAAVAADLKDFEAQPTGITRSFYSTATQSLERTLSALAPELKAVKEAITSRIADGDAFGGAMICVVDCLALSRNALLGAAVNFKNQLQCTDLHDPTLELLMGYCGTITALESRYLEVRPRCLSCTAIVLHKLLLDSVCRQDTIACD